MTVYRYLRPKAYDVKRAEIKTLTHGGICIRLDRAYDNCYKLNYVVCNEEVAFDRDIAKKIVDVRAAHGGLLIRLIDLKIETVLASVKAAVLSLKDAEDPKALYESMQARAFLLKMEDLHRQELSAIELGRLDKKIIKDLGLKRIYEGEHD